jgi:ADP-heptose:LPS heptosyltransferase
MSKLPKHILVIRLSAMGDVAMSVPVINAFVTEYPEVKITILTRAFFSPFFSDIPNVTVFVPDLNNKHKGFYGIWKLSKELLKLNIGAVADLHNVLRSNILIQLLRLKGIPFRQIDKGRAAKKALVRSENKILKPLKTSHERYADVFRGFGYNLILEEGKPLLKKPISGNILDYIGDTDKKLIGIAPFAAHEGKMYPLVKMEEVISELSKDADITILLFGGGKEEKVQLDEVTAEYSNVLNITGKFNLEDELTLISNLDVMLSMDSGNGHLAAMYGVEVISIWGVTHPYAGFVPFNQPEENQIVPDLNKYPLIPTSIYGNKYPEGYLKCFDTISPNKIIVEIKKRLKIN